VRLCCKDHSPMRLLASEFSREESAFQIVHLVGQTLELLVGVVRRH
jgi:hypothetical protein